MRLPALCLICAVAIPTAGARAQATEQLAASDAAAVRALWSALDASWNDRDAKRFSDHFTTDASFVIVDRGQPLDGRQAIRDQFTVQFPRIEPGISHATTIREIRAITPDLRAADGSVEIRVARDGAEPTVLRTFAIFALMERTADGWAIRVLRAYLLPDA